MCCIGYVIIYVTFIVGSDVKITTRFAFFIDFFQTPILYNHWFG